MESTDSPEFTDTDRQSGARERSLLIQDTFTGFQNRWDRLQTEFVEEPGHAALNAEELIHAIQTRESPVAAPHA